MDSEKYLSIYDSQVLEFIEQYSIFNGSYDKFEEFINSEDTKEFEQSTQYLLIYDNNDKIIYSKDIKIIPSKDNQLNFNMNRVKFIFHALRIHDNKKLESQTKFEKLKNNKLKNIVDLTQNVKITILEIPQKQDQKIKKLNDILHHYLDADSYDKKSLFSLQNIQLFSILSMAIVITTTLKIVNIIPIQAINESEIILAIKMIVATFSPFIFLYFLLIAIMTLPYLSDLKHVKFLLLAKIYIIKKIFILIVLVITSLTILGDIYSNVYIKNFTNLITLKLSETAANWYLRNKIALVYDKNITKPILLLGIKDGVYYYDDEFESCKLQQKIKDLNMTNTEEQKEQAIKKLLLHIDTNSSETYRNYHWKIATIKDMQFDYNITLINEAILKCDDKNITK